MIVYKDILGQLKRAGFSTVRIRKERLMSESTISRIRCGESISTETIDVICTLLHCQPGDIIEIQFPKASELLQSDN